MSAIKRKKEEGDEKTGEKEKQAKHEKSPMDLLNDRRIVVATSCQTDRFLTVRYPPCDESEEDEEDDDDSDEKWKQRSSKMTEEEVSHFRFILMDDARTAAIESASDWVTDGQAESGFMMFNTTSGNKVVFGLKGQVGKATKKKTKTDKFNALFGLTYSLKEYDFWVRDNEASEEGGELEVALSALGTAWRSLLQSSDLELGIDAEFTRPGIEAFLGDFDEMIGEVGLDNLAFPWK